MRKIKKNKGFTLIELIIVIAIIGILAAVLIPTISGYITRAHRGRDVELAGHMTTDVTLYATEYNVNMDDLTGVDVRTILLFKDYDLKPRKDGWVFAFDKTTNQVVVLDINKDGTVSSNLAPSDPIDPTHIEDNYYLVSKGNSNIEKAVDLMVNLKSEEDYGQAVSLSGGYQSVIEQFNPDNTLFISNVEVYTTAAAVNSISKIVILEKTSSLPKIDSVTYGKIALSSVVALSNTIRTSEPGSLLKNIFMGVPDIDMTKVKTIDLAAFGTNASGATIYKMEFGPHVKDSFYQNVNDEIESIVKRIEVSNGTETETGLIIKRKLTISYYNKEGLFARGSVTYAVVQGN